MIDQNRLGTRRVLERQSLTVLDALVRNAGFLLCCVTSAHLVPTLSPMYAILVQRLAGSRIPGCCHQRMERVGESWVNPDTVYIRYLSGAGGRGVDLLIFFEDVAPSSRQNHRAV